LHPQENRHAVAHTAKLLQTSFPEVLDESPRGHMAPCPRDLALALVTDFERTLPRTVLRTVPIDRALEQMRLTGVRVSLGPSAWRAVRNFLAAGIYPPFGASSTWSA